MQRFLNWLLAQNMTITRDNHYVPQMYLKRFADENGFLHRYRILVSNPSIPDWKKLNAGGVGYQRHLYTRAQLIGDSDEIEQWLSRDFEQPASEVLVKIAEDRQLRKEDYRTLTRFVAAQMVRTPAFLIKSLPLWRKQAEKQTEEALKDVRHALERSKATGIALDKPEPGPNNKYYPLRVSQERSADGKNVALKVETAVGRGTWIYAMRHLLTQTVEKFTLHKWSIIHSENHLPWFTSDDPVIALNYRNENSYDFEGGWGISRTNIIMPLSPRHLLFTQVGDKRLPNGTVFDRQTATLLRRIIAEHAHRYIFASSPDPNISVLRPRHIDPLMVQEENKEWRNWHTEQSAVERKLQTN
jgi:hypothetical protein